MGNDYVSREAAYKNMFNIPNPTGAGEIEVVSVDDLEAIPAADVRPVKQGEWRYKTMTVPGGKGQTYAKWCCSKCKSKFKDRSKFCPNCGADMTGGADV